MERHQRLCPRLTQAFRITCSRFPTLNRTLRESRAAPVSPTFVECQIELPENRRRRMAAVGREGVASFSGWTHEIELRGPIVLSLRSSQRIERFEAGKVLFVVGDDHALIRFCDGRDNHVEIPSGSSGSAALRHKPSPDQGCLLVER
jgi:hypothetical protein